MVGKPKIIGVIPARLDSTRLPGKVLRKIGNKTMVQWVYERARRSPLLDELLVATDNEQVRNHCQDMQMPVVMTGPHYSGSDRVCEIVLKTDAEIYVNIQGDEPTITTDHIELMLNPILRGESEVSTLKFGIDKYTAEDPNHVKVVTDQRDRALYFSRHPIPFNRDATGNVRYFKHIGLYGYTRKALLTFRSLPPSPLESAEKLEQLRFLENGITVIVKETQQDAIDVNTEEDLKKAASFLLQGEQQ